jgi:hypothetical protein
VHAFEPVPETFALLKRNAVEFAKDAEVVLHEAGVSSRPGTATFEIPPYSFGASMSTKDVDGALRGRGVVEWSRALLDDGVRAGLVSERLGGTLRGLLQHERLATALLTPVSMLERLQSRLRVRKVTCALTTLSDVIRAHALERIDLVKIDVEGAEEAVVDGVRPEDWPRIRQLVIEVHDVDGRLDRMAARLQGLGYSVATEREDWAVLELMGIRILYATRLPARAATDALPRAQ